MSTVIPPNELVRRAAAWVTAERAARPGLPLSRLLDDACMRFNLGPKDFLALEQLFSAPSEKRNPI